jgi:predicted DsbA family dithiol-disulfide isomerase
MALTPLQIDFVSDVACPWCAVGLASFERALEQLAGEVAVDLHFQPFELNPAMPPGGQDVTEHLTQKYGSTPEQQAAARENIRQRGEAVGFAFRKEGRGRVYNTFDAHRLLHWAGEQGAKAQRDLKMALLEAYHGQGRVMEDHAVLLDAVQAAGLDRAAAQEVLASERYTAEVRAQEQHFQQLGIQAVPSVIINGRHLIQGGQPPEVFAQALRQVAGMTT